MSNSTGNRLPKLSAIPADQSRPGALSWRSQFRDDVLRGLRATPKKLSSVYFYDDTGSALFDEITRLPEYYLTRAEHEILETYAHDIVQPMVDHRVCLVDLGAGSGGKTQILLRALNQHGVDTVYAPIDVSSAALQTAEQSARAQWPTLQVAAVQDDYTAGLARVRAAQADRKLIVLWLGSSIGNLIDTDAVGLLKRMAAQCAQDDILLIGFDLLKDPKTLIAAYDDSRGITAQFNFNLLKRINRDLQGNFDVGAFAHYATFNASQGRMESYLISRKTQNVAVAGQSIALDAWEPIQTEISCKYSRSRIAKILDAAGLSPQTTYVDAQERFADVICAQLPLAPKRA